MQIQEFPPFLEWYLRCNLEPELPRELLWRSIFRIVQMDGLSILLLNEDSCEELIVQELTILCVHLAIFKKMLLKVMHIPLP